MSCRRRSNSAREPFFCMGCDVCDCRARVAIGRHPKRTHPKRSPPRAPSRYRALPGPLPAPSRAPVHRLIRAPLSRSPPVPFTHTPSLCTVIALCPHSPPPSRQCVHRPRAPLSRSVPCTFPCTRAPSPCTVISRSAPVPSLPLRVHPCTVPVHRYRSLPRSPAPSRAPVHRPRAPLSRSAPVPFLHLPVHPCTVPVHRYRALPRSPAPVHRPRAPLPRSPAPSPAPMHRPCAPLSRSAPIPFLHLPVHPYTVRVHRYRSLPPSPAPSRARPCTVICTLSTRTPCPCTVIALCPGALHNPRAPLSRSARSPPCPSAYTRALPPCTIHRPGAPLSRSAPVPSCTFLCTRAPSPCTVIALCPGPLHPYTVPVHRYRALPRSPAPCALHPCTVPVHRYRSLPRCPAPCRARPCTVIALCPGPLHPCTPSPCTVIAFCPGAPPRTPVHRPRAPLSLAAPFPAPSRTPVHRPRRAPLSRSARSPSCTFPCTRAPSYSCTVIALSPGPLHPYTVPVHRYRALPPFPSTFPSMRAPSPCTVIALGPLHLPVHPCTVPVHRYRSLPRSPAPSRARPCTVIALCPGPFLHLPVHPYTVPMHPLCPGPLHLPASDNGARGRCTGAREGAGDRAR